MMEWRRIAVVLTVAILFAPIASAQGNSAKCEEAEKAARSETLDRLPPFAGATHAPGFVYATDGPNCRIVTFYRMLANPTRPSTPEEFRELRRDNPFIGKVAPPSFAARYIDDSNAAPYRARWTDQAQCPELISALEKLEAILAPKLVGDGPHRYGSISVSDQPRIRFWMSDQVYPQDDPDFRLNYTLEGGSSAPFGSWLFNTFKALAPCWSDNPPATP